MFRVDLNIHIHHHHQDGAILADLKSSLEQFMGELRDEFAKLENLITEASTEQDAALERVSTDVVNFNTQIADMAQQIADLKQKIADGENDPVFIQRVKDAETNMQKIIDNNKALDPTKTDVLPDAPTV